MNLSRRFYANCSTFREARRGVDPHNARRTSCMPFWFASAREKEEEKGKKEKVKAQGEGGRGGGGEGERGAAIATADNGGSGQKNNRCFRAYGIAAVYYERFSRCDANAESTRAEKALRIYEP